jgi:hypothetical protein
MEPFLFQTMDYGCFSGSRSSRNNYFVFAQTL